MRAINVDNNYSSDSNYVLRVNISPRRRCYCGSAGPQGSLTRLPATACRFPFAPIRGRQPASPASPAGSSQLSGFNFIKETETRQSVTRRGEQLPQTSRVKLDRETKVREVFTLTEEVLLAFFFCFKED